MSDAAEPADTLKADISAAIPQKRKLPLIIAGVGVVALAVGVGFALRGSSHAAAPAAKGEAPAAAGAAEAGGVGPIVAVDVIVNLESDEEELRYLKCGLAVEIADPKLVPVFEKQLVRVRNAVLLYLSGLKLSDTVGAAKKQKIQDTLRDRVKEIAGDATVKNVFITEFILQ